MTASKIQMDQIRSTSATCAGENIRAGSQKKSSLSPAEGLQGASPDATCTCPSGGGSLRHPCPAHPAPVELAGGDERDLQGAQGERDGWGPLPIVHVPWNVFDRAVMWVEDRRRYGDDGTIVDDWKALKTIQRAALAQPSTTLPPFAEKVLAKLHRFYDCVSDFESGGVDIGRHWLDLLTQLGLLNRVQRSPALWEITQQGEDLLGTSQPSPASDLDPLNLAPHAKAFNEAPAEALKSEQAEAERPEVVGVRYEDGTILSAEDCGTALEVCAKVQTPLMTVAQHERIVGALRAERDGAIKLLGQSVWQKIERLTQERDAALARVAELEAKLADLEKQEPIGWFAQYCETPMRRMVQWGTKVPDCAADTFYPLYAAPVAQAQHGVPGKYDDVLLPFLKLMEHELHANAGKGDRPGWLQMDRKTALLEIYYHLGKLQKATRDNDPAGIVEYAADVANMAMMLVDVCGLLAAAPARGQHSVPAYVSYTTRPAESLAGIALRQLKDESRWVEIRDINAHAFPDMQSHSYYPAGTVIKLPAAAEIGKSITQPGATSSP